MYEEEIKRLSGINAAHESFTGVQHVIDVLGEYLLPDKFPGPEIFGNDAVARFKRMEQKLLVAGYPVEAHVAIGQTVTGVSLDVIDPNQPDNYVTLFGFHIGTPGGPFDDLGLDLLLLHKRHRGAESLLREIFGPME